MRGYRPKQAHIKAEKRRQEAGKIIKMTFDVINTRGAPTFAKVHFGHPCPSSQQKLNETD